jgi:hypothetical protein
MNHSRMSVAEFKALGNRESRPKFNARRCEMDGIKFDSLAEREFYALLKADKGVLHVDVHPTLTLPGGVRYKVDFVAYLRDEEGQQGVIAYEVKGAMTPDFRIKRKLFDQFHPLAPLKVYRKRGKAWVEI